MELLFELLFELVFEGSVEIAKDRKTPKWLRFPLIVLLTLFVVGLLGGLLGIGVWLIVTRTLEIHLPLGVVLLALDGVLIFSAWRKVRDRFNKRRAFSKEKTAPHEENKGEEKDGD